MNAPDDFDALYQDARDRLLLQTYAFTGDLTASQKAVRDSFVGAWHHWRKVARAEDPEAWVRTRAWSSAQRRRTARLRHRDQGRDPDVTRTFDALGRLTLPQRKVLVLTHLSTLSLDEVARETGLTRAEAERSLQTASTQLALHRDVPSTAVRALFEPLRGHVASAPWPRPTILRRAGAARRRTRTTAGAVAAVAALVVSGTLVTDTGGLRPTLDRDTVAAVLDGSSEERASATAAPVPPPTLPPDAMLTSDWVGTFVDGRRWRLERTTDNTRGDGIVAPCQQDRYADPRGKAGLVSTFDTTPRRRQPEVSAVQATEVSRTNERARRAFDVTAGWYAGCEGRRVQLLSTQRVRQVGDEAVLLVLRDWGAPARTITVGVARTGRTTTTTLVSVAGTAEPGLRGAARLLSVAVRGLCDLPDAGGCDTPRPPTLVPAASLPVGEVPAMLSSVDLPPVPGVERPWVGTEPRRAVRNVASTSCDRVSFTALSHNVTRSFVIPRARLAPQFGLTETIGSLPARRAAAFVDTVRARLASCPDKDLGTAVASVRQVATADRDVGVWRVRSELSDSATITYLMGIVRRGTSLAQIGFVPDREAGISSAAFDAIVQRALDRLGALPPPRRRG